MLGHSDRDRRQLLDLVAHRITNRHVVILSEHLTAVAVIRPVIDDPIDRPRRQQRPPLALMPWLAALPATRRILPAPGRRTRRIRARRLRAVARASVQPALELRDPLTLPSNRLRELLDLAIHPQQHLDHNIAARVIDRLGLNPIHTSRFDAPELCPPDQLNGYMLPVGRGKLTFG